MANGDATHPITTTSGIADTLANGGSTAAAPAAGATIATLAAPPAGVYRVTATVLQSGTPDANSLNAVVKKGAAAVTSVPSVAAQSQITLDRVTLDGTTALNLTTGAAIGGAGAIYNGTITATRIA